MMRSVRPATGIFASAWRWPTSSSPARFMARMPAPPVSTRVPSISKRTSLDMGTIKTGRLRSGRSHWTIHRMKQPFLACTIALTLLAGPAIAQAPPKTKAPDNASVYFLSPKDGETVSSPFTVRFGLKGMGVAPAGVTQPNTGHHHLLIDMATPPDFNAALPGTDNI